MTPYTLRHHQLAGAPPTWNALVMLLSAGSSAPTALAAARPSPTSPPMIARANDLKVGVGFHPRWSVSYGLQAEVHGLTTMIARANDHDCTG